MALPPQGKHPLMDDQDDAPDTLKAAADASRSKTVGFQQQEGQEDTSIFDRMGKGWYVGHAWGRVLEWSFVAQGSSVGKLDHLRGLQQHIATDGWAGRALNTARLAGPARYDFVPRCQQY